MWLFPRLSSLYLLHIFMGKKRKQKQKKDYKLDFSIAEVEHHILLGVDLSRGYRRQFRVQGALRLSCPCVTSDEGGDRVVSLWEAAVSSSWSLWASCTWISRAQWARHSRVKTPHGNASQDHSGKGMRARQLTVRWRWGRVWSRPFPWRQNILCLWTSF